MSDLPQGIVTFVFTDVEGRTRLWEEAPDVMMEALNLHDEAVDPVVETFNGVSVKPRGEGDSRFLVSIGSGGGGRRRRIGATSWRH